MHTLFVALPNRTTVAMRRVEKSVPVTKVKARLELEAGIPSHVYVMFFGESQLNDDDVIEFQAGIKNGAVIRLCIKEEWKDLYMAVINEDSDEVLELCKYKHTNCSELEEELEQSGHGPSQVTVLDADKATIALFVSSFNGYLCTVKKLVNLAGRDIVLNHCNVCLMIVYCI